MKRPINWILAIGMCLGFVIWSLGFWNGGCAIKQSNPNLPEVISVFPEKNAGGVETYLAVSVTFSKNMDASSINASTFTLSSAEGAVPGNVNYDAGSKTAAFIPSKNLSLNTAYTAVVSDNVKDPEGNKLTSPYSWSFTTGLYLTAVGTLDVTFSDGTHQGYGAYYEVSRGLIPGVAQASQGESMIFDSRGRILVAGKGRYQLNNTEFLDNLAVWRIRPDGSLDKSFGSEGTFHSTFEGEEIGRSIIIDSNDKILVTGDRYSLDLNNNGLAIWRLTPDGLADETFGTNGAIIYTPFDRGYSIALDPSGNICILGYSFGIRTKEGFSILRFQPDGTFDKAFDVSATPEGVVFRTEYSTTEAAGKILHTAGSNLTRYNSNGTVDTNFGENGMVNFPGGEPGDEITGKSIIVDTFGRVVVMGNIVPQGFISTGKPKMAVWRYK